MGFRRSGCLLGHSTKKRTMVTSLPLSIFVTLCVLRQRREMTLHSFKQLHHPQNQINPLGGTLTSVNLHHCTKWMFLQPIMTQTRTACCTTNLILSKDAGHSETNLLATERPSSQRKENVSDAAIPSHTSPKSASPL